MPKYVKKPFVINAVHFGNTDFDKMEHWALAAYRVGRWSYRYNEDTGIPCGYVVHTLGGDMIGEPGSYLIMGVKGELYPCRGDIFEETYDLVE